MVQNFLGSVGAQRPWDVGVADTLETLSCRCPTSITIPNSVALGQTVWPYYTLFVPPFKVTQGHWNRHVDRLPTTIY